MNTPAKAYFCCLVRRPTMPKSMSTSVPSGRTSTLPGCGSAWKNAELENLGQVHVHALFGHLRRAQAPLQQLRLVGDFAAAHELNHQDAVGAQLAVGLRDIERVVVGVRACETAPCCGPRRCSPAPCSCCARRRPRCPGGWLRPCLRRKPAVRRTSSCSRPGRCAPFPARRGAAPSPPLPRP